MRPPVYYAILITVSVSKSLFFISLEASRIEFFFFSFPFSFYRILKVIVALPVDVIVIESLTASS